ncbi:uncharacterized protein Z520_04185 [Fonsecaea multimorphosa CBS 102226]|uniref:Uncharacterized protein n=1 Tax=Fonsecaea multimorphosa CBS 102226 TaxID=1442371 RepID=A0A0D2KBK8_9EURO|nr:uncharacterized protein Z520_04185 [Fonsecaea multimorphosa CBS 102226]KIY00500.1 hypothetical protein Z520_04185 [Fonsecaea multimorphosa CBS 102226]OAL27015.1 hypothetical protein AYO22_03959 [Fonsecaea multimorphosa]
MQLRKCVTIPTRFEDEVHIAPQNGNGTKPAYPKLLQAQIVPFNPNNPPAAFPSLPLTSVDAPVARNPSGFEELVNVPHTVDSLSNGGLRISLDGSSAVQEDLPQTERRTVSPIAMQRNARMPVGLIINGPRAAEVASTSSENDCNVTWDLLPLSLQFHIYRVLLANYSPKLVPKLLGLTEHEASQIQKAVGMRVLHPASVEEIWDYCSKAGVEGPATLESPSSIDADVFNEYVGYMIFASNYELAFEAEVRLAKDFLSSRGIATDLLGTWLPDPSDAQFGGLYRHVPGTTDMSLPSNNQLHADSGYSSFSEADQTRAAQRSERRLRPRQDLIKKKAMEKRSTGDMNPNSLVYSIKHRPTSQRPLIDLDPNLMVKIKPHPLATVTKVGEFFDPSGVPLSKRLLKAEECSRDSAGGDTSQEITTKSSEKPSPIGIAPNPQRLILKIHNKDGLARILRKNPSPLTPPNSGNTTAVSLDGLANPSQPSSLIPPAFAVSSSGLSTGPLVKDVERPPNDGTLSITSARPATRPLVESQPVAPEKTKRKPSQSDIGPDISKVQRMLIDAAPVNPSQSISHESNSDIGQLHTEAKRSHKLSTAQLIAAIESTLPLESMRSRSPPSPSYSPISENEDLEELQARLRGPMMDRMRSKMPDQGKSLALQSELALDLSSLSNPTFRANGEESLQAAGNSGNITSEHESLTTAGEETMEKKSAKRKKGGAPRGPRGPYRKTRERLAKQAEKEGKAGNGKRT